MDTYWDPLVAQLVKNLPAMRETWVQSLGWEDSLEKWKATHYNILAWRIPRVAKIRTLITWAPIFGVINVFVSLKLYSKFYVWVLMFCFPVNTIFFVFYWKQRYLCTQKCLRKILFAFLITHQFSSVQSLSRVWLCDSMNCSTPGLHVHHQLQESAQTHVHQVGDATQPSLPLSSPSPTHNLSQHQGLFK